MLKDLSRLKVRRTLPSPDPSHDTGSSAQAEDSSDSLASYIDLHSAHRALQNTHASTLQELETLKAEHEETMRALRESSASSARASTRDDSKSKTEGPLKVEIDRLQAELTKSEQIIADSEQLTAQQQKAIETLTKQLEDLQPKAELAEKLKDEMDEYRHAAEKSRKLEATVEKLKKKLEESNEIKRALKLLEDENVLLLEKNTSLESDLQSVEHYKSLIESHKDTISTLEGRNRDLTKDREELRLDLNSSRAQVAELQVLKADQAETVALLEERIRQLDDPSSGRRSRKVAETAADTITSSDDEDSANELSGMANELDDAVSGVSTVELKLQIRRLQRDLEAAHSNKADSSRIVILENLLEDAQRMKARYEEEFLKEHKEKLVLQRQMEEVRQGTAISSNK